MDLFDLAGKVAIITGGSKGIGRAIAERMAEAGAKVVVSSRKLDKCEDVAKAIQARGGDATAIACNVSHMDQLENLVDKTMNIYGRIDILVGNAAVNPHFGPMTEIEESAFDKIMDSNIKANLWLARMVLPQMAERKDGVIIILSSIAGIKGTDDIGVYGISKAADSALVRQSGGTLGRAQHSLQRDRAGPDQNRFRARVVGKPRAAGQGRGELSIAPGSANRTKSPAWRFSWPRKPVNTSPAKQLLLMAARLSSPAFDAVPERHHLWCRHAG